MTRSKKQVAMALNSRALKELQDAAKEVVVVIGDDENPKKSAPAG